jgi:lipid-binding SYLF domain-containing protein
MEKAVGIAVVPEWTKAALIAGGSYGSGILSAKRKDGHWTDPLFLSLTGGSVGVQAGFKTSELILVFTDREVLDQLAKNEDFTIGADASMTAGDVDKSQSAQMNDAKILTYEKSSGLFAGASLDGTVLKVQQSPTLAYYRLSDNSGEARGYFGKENANASLYGEIISSDAKHPTMSKAVVPDSAREFKNAVEHFISSIQSRSKP